MSEASVDSAIRTALEQDEARVQARREELELDDHRYDVQKTLNEFNQCMDKIGALFDSVVDNANKFAEVDPLGIEIHRVDSCIVYIKDEERVSYLDDLERNLDIAIDCLSREPNEIQDKEFQRTIHFVGSLEGINRTHTQEIEKQHRQMVLDLFFAQGVVILPSIITMILLSSPSQFVLASGSLSLLISILLFITGITEKKNWHVRSFIESAKRLLDLFKSRSTTKVFTSYKIGKPKNPELITVFPFLVQSENYKADTDQVQKDFDSRLLEELSRNAADLTGEQQEALERLRGEVQAEEKVSAEVSAN